MWRQILYVFALGDPPDSSHDSLLHASHFIYTYILIQAFVRVFEKTYENSLQLI
jgi:hypothetical protein